MHKVAENGDHNFPTIWDSFLTFENVSRERDEKLDAFINRWKEKMALAQAAGCSYSDTVLACKLLQNANLDGVNIKEIVHLTLQFGKSEILCNLLRMLEDYPYENSERVKEETANCDIDNGISGLMKEEFQAKSLNASSPAITLEDEGFPELEIKDEFSETSASFINVDLSELTNEVMEENNTGTEIFEQQENISEYQTDDCDESTQDTERKRNIIGNRHQCHDCHKSFKSVYSLRNHMRWHTNELPFQCSQCSYRTVYKYHINMHIRTKHHGELPFKCSFCKKAFKSGSGLKYHTMREHTNEPLPYQCSHCSYSAFLKCRLDQHIRIHTGERPFKCIVCEKEYATKPLLTRHMDNAHGKDDNEKNPFGYQTESAHSENLKEEESALIPESKSFSEISVKPASEAQVGTHQ